MSVPVAPAAVKPRPGAKLGLRALYEGLLTAILLIGVETITRWTFGPSTLSRNVTSIHGRLAIVGVVVAVLLAALILTPLGRASGGHMNPGISVAMWRYGLLEPGAVPLYLTAQLAGSVVGVLIGRLLWGPVTGRPPLSYAVLHPAPGWNAAGVFPVEAASMATIIVIIALFLGSQKLASKVPFAVGTCVGLVIFSLGPVTGGVANPARQFGPAVISGQTQLLWVFLLAPLIGGFLAPVIQRFLPGPKPTTHALCGPAAQRS